MIQLINVADGVARLGDVLYWQDPDWPCYDEEFDDPNMGLHWGPLEDIYDMESVGIKQENDVIGPRMLGRLSANKMYLDANNM